MADHDSAPLAPREAAVPATPPGGGMPPVVDEPSNEPDEATIAVLTARQEARNTKLRRAGLFAGRGYPIQWIAERFGEQPATVRKWQNDAAFLEGYASAEGAAAREAALSLSKIALSLPDLIDTSIAVAMDSGHKDSSVERRFLIDKVLIPMTVQHNTHNVADPRAVEALSKAFEAVTRLVPAPVPQLLDGKSAAAQYGALPGGGNGAAVDAEVVTETKQ
jgi:hypothetical protein